MTISGTINQGIDYSSFFKNTSVNQNAMQKNIASMWSSYASSQQNASTNIAALQEVRTNAAALVASYDEAKTAFYNEFDANMQNLATSAKTVRNFDFASVTADTSKPAETTGAFSAAGKVIENVTEAKEQAAEAQANLKELETVGETEAEELSAAGKVIEALSKAEEKSAAAAERAAGASAASVASNEPVPTGATGPRVVQSEFGTTVIEEHNSNQTVNKDGSVTTTNPDGSTVTSIGNGAITRTETYDDQGHKRIETAYSKVMQSALKTVRDFVDNYNASIEFFQGNSEVSGRVNRMAELFGDTTYRAQSYESIGIKVAGDGSMTLDEEQLAQAIVDNPERVTNILGGDGLADKAESHVDVANSQRNQLFPNAQSMFGEQLDSAAFYTSNAFLQSNNYSNLGNLVNMMF